MNNIDLGRYILYGNFFMISGIKTFVIETNKRFCCANVCGFDEFSSCIDSDAFSDGVFGICILFLGFLGWI
jgi:hypothetical protein